MGRETTFCYVLLCLKYADRKTEAWDMIAKFCSIGGYMVGDGGGWRMMRYPYAYLLHCFILFF